MTNQRTALIIGAGPAGLTAAYELLTKTEIKPLILEASPYIGGISRTAVHNGNRMDIGGHRFFTKDARVQAIWDELLPLQGAASLDDKALGKSDMPLTPGGPDPEQTDRVMLMRNRVSRIFYNRKFFDYPISLKAQTFKNMGFKKTMHAGFGYMASAVRKRPEDSLENFYINRFGKPLYGMFFESYTEKVWGRHPSQISAAWGAQRVKGLSLMKTVMTAVTKPFRPKDAEVETSLIEQFRYPKRGPGQFWETMASEIERLGGTILMEHEVDRIRVGDGEILAVEAKHGEHRHEFTADYYFNTMAIKDLFEAMDGPVPEDIRRIAVDLPYRDFMTVGLLLKKLELKNETAVKTLHGGVPDNWIYIQEPDVEIGRLQIFNNWSPYMVEDPKNTVWVGLEYFSDEGDKLWRMNDADFVDFAIKELEKIGIIEREHVLDAVRIRVKKAYPAYFGSYESFDRVQAYLDTFGQLYPIGRNGQHRYNNMDHSMLTAMTAVDSILGKIDKQSVWTVNTEKEYHETEKKSAE